MKLRYYSFFKILIFSALVVLGLSLGACSGSHSREKAAVKTPDTGTNPVWPVMAILKAGANPLWFEYSEKGPRLIPSPAEASLTEYKPWPLSRFSAGMLVYNSDLVLAVNRDGFLVFSPNGQKNQLILYRIADPVNWDPYTIACLFMYDEKPAVLLRRDDFFSFSQPPVPEFPVLILAKDNPVPMGVHVPVLDRFLRGEGWEVNALRKGSDQNWYFRLVETGKDQPGIAYFRVADLDGEGEKINAADFWNSFQPESEFGILSFLGPLAAALTPDGEGFAFRDGEETRFSLPPLPENFVYTAAGLAGDTVIASWEEQDESAVGAAGFMVLGADAPGLF